MDELAVFDEGRPRVEGQRVQAQLDARVVLEERVQQVVVLPERLPAIAATPRQAIVPVAGNRHPQQIGETLHL